MSKARDTINEIDDRQERLARQEKIYAVHRKFYKLVEDTIGTLEKGLESTVAELVKIEDDPSTVQNSMQQLLSHLEVETKYLTKRMSKSKIRDLMKKGGA